MRTRPIYDYTSSERQDGHFHAQYKGGDYIFCTIDNGKILQVPKKEFRSIYAKWEKYVSNDLSRTFLENNLRFTKYTTSIIRHYLNQIGAN
ncbi:MAG: hypothetical protein KGI27_00885 [Thaumarchaeota archaeon]|nr:hypothetical protein [Nitrososphaerota archaeon]